MKFVLRRLIPLIVLTAMSWVPARAQELAITAVPDTLPAEERAALQARRLGLVKEWNELLLKRAAYVSEFKGTRATDTQRVAQAAQRKAQLGAEAERIAGEADDFMETVTIAVHIGSLTKQIHAAEQKLHALGFKQRAEDFEQIKGISDIDMAKLKSRLFLRLQGLVNEEPEERMRGRFLGEMRNLRPGQIRNLQASLGTPEIADPVFLEWLQSIQPNKPKAGLETDEKVLVDFLRREKGLGKYFENLDPDAIETQQEAVLTLLSLVVDHPYFNELRGVAAGNYDVSETWFYVSVLDMEAATFAAVTDDQLATQKLLLRRMKDLIEERAMLRTEMEKLKTPATDEED